MYMNNSLYCIVSRSIAENKNRNVVKLKFHNRPLEMDGQITTYSSYNYTYSERPQLKIEENIM